MSEMLFDLFLPHTGICCIQTACLEWIDGDHGLDGFDQRSWLIIRNRYIKSIIPRAWRCPGKEQAELSAHPYRHPVCWIWRRKRSPGKCPRIYLRPAGIGHNRTTVRGRRPARGRRDYNLIYIAASVVDDTPFDILIGATRIGGGWAYTHYIPFNILGI